MAVLIVPIRTEAEANQFISIMHSKNMQVDTSQLGRGKATCTVGESACIWERDQDYIGTRRLDTLEYCEYKTITVNQLYERLKERK